MKKVSLITMLFAVLFAFKSYAQEEYETYATYTKFLNGKYIFVDDYEENVEFMDCSDEVLKSFDLKSNKLVNQFFYVTYVILNEDEEADQYKIVRLEKAESE